jgi:hypothetical protein
MTRTTKIASHGVPKTQSTTAIVASVKPAGYAECHDRHPRNHRTRRHRGHKIFHFCLQTHCHQHHRFRLHHCHHYRQPVAATSRRISTLKPASVGAQTTSRRTASAASVGGALNAVFRRPHPKYLRIRRHRPYPHLHRFHPHRPIRPHLRLPNRRHCRPRSPDRRRHRLQHLLCPCRPRLLPAALYSPRCGQDLTTESS